MWSKYRKVALLVFGVGIFGILIFGIDYFRDISYQGDSDIRFLEGEYTNLEDLFNEEPFKNKVLYVDLWFSSCPPCIKEFKKLPGLKESLKDQKDIEYLYISHQTRHPNTQQLWKNAIQQYNLTGWHYMMDRAFEERMWSYLNKRDTSIRQGYPRYLIIDNTSDYRNYNAPKPSELAELKAILIPELKP